MSVRDAIKKWSVRQQWKLWQALPGCRQSREMLRKPPNAGLSKCALALPRQKLRILVGLVASRADLNRHLYIMKVGDDELCPFCQEEEESLLHFLAKYVATMNIPRDNFGQHLLDYNELSRVHVYVGSVLWSLLNPLRDSRTLAISRLCIRPDQVASVLGASRPRRYEVWGHG